MKTNGPSKMKRRTGFLDISSPYESQYFSSIERYSGLSWVSKSKPGIISKLDNRQMIPSILPRFLSHKLRTKRCFASSIDDKKRSIWTAESELLNLILVDNPSAVGINPNGPLTNQLILSNWLFRTVGIDLYNWSQDSSVRKEPQLTRSKRIEGIPFKLLRPTSRFFTYISLYNSSTLLSILDYESRPITLSEW